MEIGMGLAPGRSPAVRILEPRSMVVGMSRSDLLARQALEATDGTLTECIDDLHGQAETLTDDPGARPSAS